MTFLSDFISSEKDKIFALINRFEKNWSSEEQVHYYLAPEKIPVVSSHQEEVETRIRRRSFKVLDSKEKLAFYFLFKILKVEFKDSSALWQIEMILEELRKRLSGSEIVKTIEELGEEHFLLFLETFFRTKERRRIFYSSLYGARKRGKDKISLYSMILRGDFDPYLAYLPMKKPKPKVFRKGYRDHGSLGPATSRIRKEEAKDLFLQEEIQRREKINKDTLDFIKGLIGSE